MRTIRTIARMLLVRVALLLAGIAAAAAAALGATAEKLPDVLAPVPAVCVTTPPAGNVHLQAGYCPE